MNFVYSVIITIFIFVLLLFVVPRHNSSPEYVKIANSITAKTARRLEQKHQMNLIGTGGGMMKQVNMMGMSFQLHYPLELEEARQIVVSSVEEFLHDINSSEAVRPFLVKYPFPPENIEVFVFFSQPSGYHYCDPHIGAITLFDGMIYYVTYESIDNCKYKNEIDEPYSEALEIVRKEAPELLPNSK